MHTRTGVSSAWSAGLELGIEIFKAACLELHLQPNAVIPNRPFQTEGPFHSGSSSSHISKSSHTQCIFLYISVFVCVSVHVCFTRVSNIAASPSCSTAIPNTEQRSFRQLYLQTLFSSRLPISAVPATVHPSTTTQNGGEPTQVQLFFEYCCCHIPPGRIKNRRKQISQVSNSWVSNSFWFRGRATYYSQFDQKWASK